ncbi:coagulation factor IIIa [Megalops cyprinoides]|uniref:coagulation factor IIIa n=1 Tax=Megalops cyprinoides TaxID=118141 RepID=UPI001864EDA7|nr:coagulation factor IIIa [Megalops cyprinoides]
MLETRICTALLFSFFYLIGEVAGTYPRAQNVRWSSSNFKTLLQWSPEPTNYSYTVEFSVVGKNRERNPHCIRSSKTECDLTSMLTDLKATYSADVISEPLPGQSSDLPEFPHTRSDTFCPYKDTDIGRPDFSIEVNKEKDNITLYIKDPPSAIYKDGKQLNMRDIFMNDLKYRVTYRRATSTGKKTADTDSNQITLKVDKGESYCFNVEAYIPTRSPGKQLGEMSMTKCSQAGDRPFYEEYGIGTIVCAILIIIVAIAVAITVTVVCCKRRGRAGNRGKEGTPLNSV